MKPLADAFGDEAAAAAASRRQRGCPPPDRCWAVALGLSAWNDGERPHLSACPSCRSAVRRLRWRVRHPSWWTLQRATLGLLPADEAGEVRRHLEMDGCGSCGRRRQRLAGDEVVSFTAAVPLPDPRTWAAAGGGLDQAAASADGRLKAHLLGLGRDVILEVRTRDAALDGRLVACGCAGDDEEPLLAFAVLRPDVNGWFAAQVRWDASELHARLCGSCRGLMARVLEPGLLTAAETDALRASIDRDGPDERSMTAWRQWRERALVQPEPLSEEVRVVLRSHPGTSSV
jgi:hypothetical protein